MTGAVMALAGAGIAAGGGGGVTPGPLNWADLFGLTSAATRNLSVGGIAAPITISAAKTGPATLYAVRNGVPYPYSGAFTVVAGNTLGWQVNNTGSIVQSGVITVTNVSDGGATLDTINYILDPSRA